MELIHSSLREDANLRAYYRLENGVLTVDNGANGYTLTNNNAVADGGGKFGGGADLGNANSNKGLVVVSDLGITTKVISVSMWVKLNTEILSNSWVLFFNQNTTQDWGIEIWYEYNAGTRRLSYRSTQSGIGSNVNTYNISLGTDSWYHLVFTSDGTDQRAYLNGVLVGGPIAIRTSGNNITSATSIGYYYPANNYFASSVIDDVAIFSKALSQAEITELYTEKSNFFLMF